MLRRVQAGRSLGALPPADVHSASDVADPATVRATPSGVVDGVEVSKRSVVRWGVAFGVVLVTVATAAFLASQRPSDPTAPGVTTAAAPAASPPQHAPSQPPDRPAPTPQVEPPHPAPTPPTPAPTTVRVHIDTTPAGATVEVDGETRGRTPFNLELPQGSSAVEVTLRARGRAPLVQQNHSGRGPAAHARPRPPPLPPAPPDAWTYTHDGSSHPATDSAPRPDRRLLPRELS